MTEAVAEAIATVRPHPVVNLEEGQVWISGMNARVWVLARRMQAALTDAGIETGEPTDDDAVEHGGLILPVPKCEPISEEAHQQIMAHAAK